MAYDETKTTTRTTATTKTTTKMEAGADVVTGPERLDAYRLARELHRLVHDLAPHGSGLGDPALDLLDVLTTDERVGQARPLAVRVVQTTSGLLRRHRAP